MNSEARIARTFAKAKAHIAYLTAGDGGIERTFAAACALIKGGVNMLEIGVPFSDPIADGPVIQAAAARALQAGTSMQAVLQLAKNIREVSEIPLILFSYVNPILAAMSSFDFFAAAKQAGINGLLLVDCPFEESAVFHQACLQHEIAPIYVLTPSTPLERIQQIDQYGCGFLYYACRPGTTGLRDSLPADFIEKIAAIRAVTHLPVVVGFGIAKREMAEQALQHADGVVIGSLFVKALHQGQSMNEMTILAQRVIPRCARDDNENNDEVK